MRMDVTVLWILLLLDDAFTSTIRYDSFASSPPMATQIEASVSRVSARTSKLPHESTARTQVNRRQRNKAKKDSAADLLDQLEKIRNDRTDKRDKKPGKSANESLYEAYWPGGEWVYKRTQRTRRKKRPIPIPTTPTISGTTSHTTTTPTTTTMFTNNTETTTYVNYVCQHPCSDLFENYGTVCAHRFSGWGYQVREFWDACEMIKANCVYHATTPKKDALGWDFYRGQWMLIKRGPCHQLSTLPKLAPTNAEGILKRMKLFVDINMLQYRTKGKKK